MKRPTQNERMLAFLKDGLWHDITEIHREAGVGRPNSRASNLREAGHNVVHEIRNGRHGYRLVPLDAAGPRADAFRPGDGRSSSGAAPLPPAASSGPSLPSSLTPDGGWRGSSAAQACSEQLTLEAA